MLITSHQVARQLIKTQEPQLIPSMCIGVAPMAFADLADILLIPDSLPAAGVMTGLFDGIYFTGLRITRQRAGII